MKTKARLPSFFFLERENPPFPMGLICRLAEKQGFEPWLGLHPLMVFETIPFDHLGTSPWRG
jgi:hypothetical protein